MLEQNNPNEALIFDDDDQLGTVASSLEEMLSAFDDRAEGVRDDLFIDSATDKSLEQLGEQVRARRPDGEPEEQYRTRVRATYGQATSKTTIEEFALLVQRVLQVGPQGFSLRGASNRPVIIIETDTSVIDDTFFTESEIIDLLRDAVPMGHNVEIDAGGTFVFDGQNYTPPSNTGFGEGTLGGTVD